MKHSFSYIKASAHSFKQVNITKNIVHDRIRSINTARSTDYKSTVLTTRPQLA